MKNHNIYALRGDTEVSDVDVCTTLGLPLSLAGTPGINQAAINKMYRENLAGYQARGINPDEAYKLAGKKRGDAEQEIRDLINNP